MATWILLICAVLASLAAGVLAAYAVCQAMFGLFRMHVRNVATHDGRAAAARTA